MNSQNPVLAQLGWNTHFISQLEQEEFDKYRPVRVVAVHRNALQVIGEGINTTIPPLYDDEADEEDRATVGDWLLVDPYAMRARRLLSRKSFFKRRAAGTGRGLQLIAANVDTLFIVSSCNQDFNVARLERYLALAREADVIPVIVLTKADLADDPIAYVQKATSIMPGLLVEALDARNPEDVANLKLWCGSGQTVAFLGSSGVGKSTLVNTLMERSEVATGGVREDDDKGRHTTTGRQMHKLDAGGWLIDTPGMRELQLTDVRHGIDDVFADISALAQDCRFSDCQHDGEPDCAVLAAIEIGELEEQRFRRYRKLLLEDRFNSESLAQRRSRDRAFGKMVKRSQAGKRHQKGA